jgi:Zn-dependent M28 family amino/carboxypeptidase
MTRSVLALGLAILALLATLVAWRSDNAPAPVASGPAVDDISGSEVAAHLRFLSHDLLEGRAPSTRGGQLAAEYLASQLATLGYEPGGDNGTYFQNVSIVESVVDPSFTLTAALPGAQPGAPFTYLKDVVAFSGLQDPQVRVTGDVVFVGHGIVAPEYMWNDYEGIDVKGKVALIMVNDPPATDAEPQLFAGPALTYYGRWTYKFEEAARQGAAGAILIHTDESATYPWQVVQTSWSGTQYSLPATPGVPALGLKAWMTEDAARTLARRGGQDLDALRTAARSRGAKPAPLGVQASATVSQRVQQKVSPNVIGVLRGTGSGEAIIYTAHYDHFGVRDPRPGDPPDADRIFNGAIDNASGVSGTLEVAQAFARAPARPLRSVYIMFTTAEESGLLGSEYFASHPVLPAAAWAANINIDSMNLVGRAKDIVLLGAERSTLGPMADALATRHGRVVGPDPEPGRGYFFRSDHFPLAKIGIPALSISEPTQYIGKDPGFAKKVRDAYNAKDYHQPSDDMRADWDYTGAVEDMRFLAELGWQIANSPTMPSYHATEQFARPRAAGAAAGQAPPSGQTQ